MISSGLTSHALSAASGLLGTGSAGGASSSSSLTQARQSLFNQIDSNGDGSISQAELGSFLNQLAAARGTSAPSSATVSSMFSAMDTNHNGAISMQEFQGGGASVFDQLRGQIVSNAASTASLKASAASTAASTVSNASSTASNAAGTRGLAGARHGHMHHHGGGSGANVQSLASQSLLQYQTNGSTPATTGVGRALNLSV